MQNFYQQFKELRQDPIFKWSWRVTFLSLVLVLFFLVFKWQKLPPNIPLFYSLPWGEEQLATPLMLPVALLATLILYGLNVFWAAILYRKSTVYTHALVIGAATVTILMIYSIVKIIFLVT